MSEISEKPIYLRGRAADLLFVFYKESGSDTSVECLRRSILEGELNEIPDIWNVGLFRFLDEAIYLAKLVTHFALLNISDDKKNLKRELYCVIN